MHIALSGDPIGSEKYSCDQDTILSEQVHCVIWFDAKFPA
jgi:hypothetical protein